MCKEFSHMYYESYFNESSYDNFIEIFTLLVK